MSSMNEIRSVHRFWLVQCRSKHLWEKLH